MTKDYYKILNVTEFSTNEEIKCAYRKLARKWHPDVAGTSPDILAKFKEINEAYEILSNKVTKESYDTARRFYNYAKSSSKSNDNEQNKNTDTNKNETKAGKRGFSFNWEEILAQKQRKKEYRKETLTSKRGDDIITDLDITMYEATAGTVKIVNMLQTLPCPKCNGRRFVNGTQCPHCKGKGEISTYKKFHVKIPAGIKNNSKIRLAGEGEKGLNGGKNGDLYLVIHIIDNKSYTIDGLDIKKTVEITPADAILGGEMEISTPNGNILFKINPCTKNGQKIRLSGCGLKTLSGCGDMVVTLEIQIPTNLSQEEIELYKKLQKLNTNIK